MRVSCSRQGRWQGHSYVEAIDPGRAAELKKEVKSLKEKSTKRKYEIEKKIEAIQRARKKVFLWMNRHCLLAYCSKNSEGTRRRLGSILKKVASYLPHIWRALASHAQENHAVQQGMKYIANLNRARYFLVNRPHIHQDQAIQSAKSYKDLSPLSIQRS